METRFTSHTPLSPDELVIADELKFQPRKAKHLIHWPRTGVQQLGYIEEHMRQCGCTPRANPACHQAKAV